MIFYDHINCHLKHETWTWLKKGLKQKIEYLKGPKTKECRGAKKNDIFKGTKKIYNHKIVYCCYFF